MPPAKSGSDLQGAMIWLDCLFLGRWTPIKGIETAVRAVMAQSASTKVELTIHAFASGSSERAYAQAISALAARDARVVVKGPIGRDGLLPL